MPERRGVATLAEVLDLRRQAALGFGTGVVLAVALFVYFVAVPGSVRSPVFYVALAFVFATTFGMLATLVLVLVAGYRRVREMDDPRGEMAEEFER